MSAESEAPLLATAADPVPEGASVHWPVAGDGTRLRVACWTPGTATRGTVVVLNGRREYIEKYFELYTDLLERGFAVASQDWRGQGRSDRPLRNPECGWVDRFETYVCDLDLVLETVIRERCPPPYRLVAHSLGGHVSLRHLHDHPGAFERAFFTSPMWGIGRWADPPFWLRALARAADALGLGRRYVPGMGGDYGDRNGRFEGNVLTGDPVRFQRMRDQLAADPRLRLGAPSFGWIRAAVDSLRLVATPGWAESIATPILVCSASEDSVVPPTAIARMAERLPNARVVPIEGALHELLIERDAFRDRTLAAFDAFVGT